MSFPHLPARSWELYLHDGLDGEARGRIEAHVDACDECRRVLLAQDPSFAFRMLREPAPEGTWDGFWEELQPRLAATPVAPRSNRRAPLVAAAAAALAGIALLAVVARTPHPPTAPPPDPCDAPAIAGMQLSRAMTRAECEALYGSPIEEPQPEVVVIRELDLRGL